MAKRKAEPLIGFGAYLEKLRGARSQGQVLIKLRALDIQCSPAALSRYESGERDKPDPLILWGLARIYEIDVERLILALHANQLARAKGQSFGLRDVENVLHGTASHKRTRGVDAAEADLAWKRIGELATELLQVSGTRGATNAAGQAPTTRRKSAAGTPHSRVSRG